MNEKSFSATYSIENENYGFKYNRKLKLVSKRRIIQNDVTIEPFLSVHIPSNPNINKENFQRLRQFKYLSVIKPMDYYEENNEHILIYKDYLDYQLNTEKLEKWRRDGHIYRIILQLALFYDELERRNYNWPLKNLEDLYYVNGLLYISFADYDFESQYQQHNLPQFLQRHFSNQYQEIQTQNKENNVYGILRYLCKKEIEVDIDSTELKSFEKVLQYLLRVDIFNTIYEGNSTIKSFATPLCLNDFHPELKGEIIYKSTNPNIKEEKKKQWLENINREISLAEINTSELIVVGFIYFRIQDITFLIMQKYNGTLESALKIWKPNLEEQQKDVYTFAYRFSYSLNDLHKQRFIHRDLKLDNIFLSKKELSDSIVYVADLDRSKFLKEDKNVVLTTINKECNNFYIPPEIDEQTLKYDVFPFGQIILQVANKGIFIGKFLGPRICDTKEFDQYYSPQSIKQQLSQFHYDEEFLDIIIACLQKESSKRPSSSEIFERMSSIYQRCVDQKEKKEEKIIIKQALIENNNQDNPLNIKVQNLSNQDSMLSSAIDCTIVESILISPNKQIAMNQIEKKQSGQMEQKINLESAKEFNAEKQFQEDKQKQQSKIINENVIAEDVNIEQKIKKLQILLLKHFQKENLQ